MDKMRMESLNLTSQNVEKIETLFPNCITESRDENGRLKKSVNFKMLKQILSEDIVDGGEAYEVTWVGKKESIVEANKPIRKTLRPAPEESVDWENTENLYIEGDNLEVLKLLQESYLGKVKMIYIDTTNKSGKDIIDPMSAWFASFPEGAIQDNDKNKVNKLEVAMHPDKNLVKDQMSKIKKDGTVSGAVAYELTDLTTPVKLTAYKGVGGAELGSQEFSVK